MSIDPRSNKKDKSPLIARKKGNVNSIEELLEDDLDSEEGEVSISKSSLVSTGKSKLIVTICLVVGVLLFLTVVIIYFVKGEASYSIEQSEEELNDLAENEIVDESRPWLNNTQANINDTEENDEKQDIFHEEGKVTPGIKDISEDTVNINNSEISEDTFIKDLNSLPISANYEVDSIYTVVDFISYEKKRSITDEGIELYWLEATYKGKSAKVQVPFKIFKELDDIGVTVVDVEVVKVKGEGREVHEVVTNFVVRHDYKKILERGR